MSFNAHAYHTQKIHVANYLASPRVLESTLWQHTSNGFEVANQEDQSPFIGILVGRVSPFRLKCGPAGNHIKKEVSPLAKAKYQFHLTRPADHELGMDFDAGISVLEALQNQVGSGKEHKNMIVTDVAGKMVRMVRNVFEKRDKIIPDSPHGQSVKGAPEMDDETGNWPISDELQDDMEELKYSFQADPLPLYDDGHLVEPSFTDDVINGAIVEVHFGILHWHLSNFDSFQANVDKVIILRPGYKRHSSNYKRPHPTDDVSEPEKKKARHDESSSSN